MVAKSALHLLVLVLQRAVSGTEFGARLVETSFQSLHLPIESRNTLVFGAEDAQDLGVARLTLLALPLAHHLAKPVQVGMLPQQLLLQRSHVRCLPLHRNLALLHLLQALLHERMLLGQLREHGT